MGAQGRDRRVRDFPQPKSKSRLLKRRLPGARAERCGSRPLVEARSGAGSSTDPVLPVQKQHLKSKQRKDNVPYTRVPA